MQKKILIRAANNKTDMQMNRPCNKRQIINSAFLRWMYILILCLGSVGTYGQQQTYPVQVYTQLIPPYTPHLPAYYTGTQAKLKVMLINTDMQQPLVRVYLRMKILSSTLSLITPPEVYTAPIELQAGVPLSLSLNDLEPYFKKENLRVSGGQSELYRTQMLPDNFYRFHFEVYEEGTNRLVNNPKIGFAQAMIAAGEPPVPNLPLKGSVIKESNIPSIMFSWTPKHMNSVAAAYGTEYDISLAEIYDKRAAPEAAFHYSRILYTETTKSTSFIHTAAQPLLIPGMRYAWRVQAKAREGVDEVSVFKNNGYSAISWFDYAADCNIVQTSGAIYEKGRVDISWQDVGAMEYTVEYRKKGTGKWYTATINRPLLSQLYSLQAGKDYEYRIGSRCVAGDVFQYSTPQGFHIPDRQENGPNCGLMPNISLTNRMPVQELIPGVPVFAGDFPVFITKVSGSGRFSGEGYVAIPYLNSKYAVRFQNIVVNSDYKLIDGFFETKYDAVNNAIFDMDQYQTGGKGVGDIRSGDEQASFKVDYTINPDIKALPVTADGTKDEITEGQDYIISKGENDKYTFILTDSEGKEHKVETDSMPVTIEDKDGNTYEVNEKGEIKPLSKNSDIKLDPSTKDTQSDLAVLSFKATANTKYALDEYKEVYEKVTEYNRQYKTEGTAITASAKFMLPGASDEIAVYIKENKENKLIPEKVRFVTGKGKEYSAVYDSQTKEWTLTIVGGQANDGLELYAVQETGKDKYETLGKLNIFTYEPVEVKVKLVPVNNTRHSIDLSQVKEIYQKVGITIDIEESANFDYADLKGQKLQVTGSGLFSTETNEMKALYKAYTSYQDDTYDANTYYLFMLDEADAKEKQVPYGDMPRGKQFGYLFDGAGAEVVAHELGHGVFNLEHPFNRTGGNSFPEDALSDNLMHYHNGTMLAKLQWDQTRAPGHVIGLFEKDTDAMWTTDGHYYTVQLVALMMGFNEQKAYELGVASEKPDSYVISPREMQERTTWAVGELQQRYHALTGGYHAVELAATAYAILKTHSDTEIANYLWHRFGDAYAHFGIDNDKKGLTSYLSIEQYVTALDNYINSYLEKKFEFIQNKDISDYVMENLPFSKERTTKSRKQITKELIDFILAGDHNTKFYNDLWIDLQNNILKTFPFYANQNSFKMYGMLQFVDCFTFGHMSDNHAPDNIRERKDLFLVYLKDLIDLLSIKYNKQISSEQKARIIGKFTRIIEYASKTPTGRLDGILSLEIALLQNPNAKKIIVYIPVKYLAPDLSSYEKLVEDKADFTPNKDVKEQIENLTRYINLDQTFNKNYNLGDILPTSDGKAMKVWIFKK